MKALIIVDMQNDFINGALGTPEAQAIVPNVVNKLNEHSGTGTIVLFTKDTHYAETYENSQEGQKLPVPHCIEGTPGWSIAKPIHNAFKEGNFSTVSAYDVINSRINKSTFGSMTLAEIMFELNPDEIELVGVCTDICVMANAILLKTVLPETKIIVDASCCAGVTPEKHAAALEVMKSLQIEVING